MIGLWMNGIILICIHVEHWQTVFDGRDKKCADDTAKEHSDSHLTKGLEVECEQKKNQSTAMHTNAHTPTHKHAPSAN